MRISGATILRNVVRFGYPFEESIRSLLPLVDELVVAVGDSDDDTLARTRALAAAEPSIRVIATMWGPRTAGGEVLSEQTNAALAHCTGDWAVYLQADEVLHQDDLQIARDAMRRHLSRRTEGLLFRYHHFWRTFDLVSDDWTLVYPRAVRAVKLGAGVISAGDACGFQVRRRGRARGLIKADSGACVYHYGWCNPPDRQLDRINNLKAVYNQPPISVRDERTIFGPAMRVRRFAGTHPAAMRDRIVRGESFEAPSNPRMPAGIHAAVHMLRRPASCRSWARPLLPTALTNAWWRFKDLTAGRQRDAGQCA